MWRVAHRHSCHSRAIASAPPTLALAPSRELLPTLSTPPQALLDEVMEEFFFGDGTAWESAPPPAAVRPVLLDLLAALATVQVIGRHPVHHSSPPPLGCIANKGNGLGKRGSGELWKLFKTAAGDGTRAATARPSALPCTALPSLLLIALRLFPYRRS